MAKTVDLQSVLNTLNRWEKQRRHEIKRCENYLDEMQRTRPGQPEGNIDLWHNAYRYHTVHAAKIELLESCSDDLRDTITDK